MAIRNMWREVMGLARRFVEATEDKARTDRAYLALRKAEFEMARRHDADDAQFRDDIRARAKVDLQLAQANLERYAWLDAAKSLKVNEVLAGAVTETFTATPGNVP
jgi:hypothetical protein